MVMNQELDSAVQSTFYTKLFQFMLNLTKYFQVTFSQQVVFQFFFEELQYSRQYSHYLGQHLKRKQMQFLLS